MHTEENTLHVLVCCWRIS